jgi:hypothetical protein
MPAKPESHFRLDPFNRLLGTACPEAGLRRKRMRRRKEKDLRDTIRSGFRISPAGYSS